VDLRPFGDCGVPVRENATKGPHCGRQLCCDTARLRARALATDSSREVGCWLASERGKRFIMLLFGSMLGCAEASRDAGSSSLDTMAPSAAAPVLADVNAMERDDSLRLHSNSARARAILSGHGRLTSREIIALDDIWKWHGAAVVPDSFHRRAVSLRLDSAERLLSLRSVTAARIVDVERQLGSIADPLTTGQSARYQKIQDEVTARRRRKEDATEATKLAGTAAERRMFARNLEYRLLDRGMNVTVTTQGSNATTLRLEYILVSKVLVHQLEKDGSLLEEIRQQGFRRFVLTDGYDETWTWNF
jgi:hypothetical protein